MKQIGTDFLNKMFVAEQDDPDEDGQYGYDVVTDFLNDYPAKMEVVRSVDLISANPTARCNTSDDMYLTLTIEKAEMGDDTFYVVSTEERRGDPTIYLTTSLDEAYAQYDLNIAEFNSNWAS